MLLFITQMNARQSNETKYVILLHVKSKIYRSQAMAK